MWLNNLKKAIILKEFDTIDQLLNETPSLNSLEEIEEAAYLLQNAKALLEEEQTLTLHSLQQLKNTIDFLKSTEPTPSSSINLKL